MNTLQPPRPSFKEQMLRAREDAIVEAASRLLGEKGFETMTVDEVAAAALAFQALQLIPPDALVPALAALLDRGAIHRETLDAHALLEHLHEEIARAPCFLAIASRAIRPVLLRHLDEVSGPARVVARELAALLAAEGRKAHGFPR